MQKLNFVEAVLILCAGKGFAPSLAEQKQQRQQGQQVKGPTARSNLRPKSVFWQYVLDTPAQTALVPTSPWEDLPKTAVKSGIGREVRRTRGQN